MKFMRAFCLTLQLLCLVLKVQTLSIEEGRVLNDCLAPFGGLNEENAKRLIRFKEWSPTYEEFPCFTSCYMKSMLNIYDEQQGFNQTNIIMKYGQLAYGKCQDNFVKTENTCDMAYRGFHCLVKLETDPYILIDNIQLINAEAKAALKYCLLKFPKSNSFEYLNRYKQYPTREPIPCYTRCFIDRLQLFSYRLKQWNLTALQTTLGVPKPHTNYDHCLALADQRGRNLCHWMYTELTCFSLAI